MATARLSQATARGVSDSLGIMGEYMARLRLIRCTGCGSHGLTILVPGFAGPARKAREPAAGENVP